MTRRRILVPLAVRRHRRRCTNHRRGTSSEQSRMLRPGGVRRPSCPDPNEFGKEVSTTARANVPFGTQIVPIFRGEVCG